MTIKKHTGFDPKRDTPSALALTPPVRVDGAHRLVGLARQQAQLAVDQLRLIEELLERARRRAPAPAPRGCEAARLEHLALELGEAREHIEDGLRMLAIDPVVPGAVGALAAMAEALAEATEPRGQA